MKVDGACFCGQITYEAELNTDRIVSATARIARRSQARHSARSPSRRRMLSPCAPASSRFTSKSRTAATGASRPSARTAARPSMRPRSRPDPSTASVSAPLPSAINWFRRSTSTTARNSTGWTRSRRSPPSSKCPKAKSYPAKSKEIPKVLRLRFILSAGKVAGRSAEAAGHQDARACARAARRRS